MVWVPDSSVISEMLLKVMWETRRAPHWDLRYLSPLRARPWGCVHLRDVQYQPHLQFSFKPSCRESIWPPSQGRWSLCGEMWPEQLEGRADFYIAGGAQLWGRRHYFHSCRYKCF